MKQIAVSPPPLPPKNRPAPPEEATVNERPVVETSSPSRSSADSAYISSIPEVASPNNKHVVKIHINPTEPSPNAEDTTISSIRISVNSEDMINNGGMSEISEKSFFYYGAFNSSGMSSGQVSPSDTLDSGTCSDMDGTPPPLPKKKSSGVTVTLIGQQNKRLSCQEGDSDNDSNISCDSLNSSDSKQASAYLPQGLLKDIRDRSSKLTIQSQSPETIIPHIEEDEEMLIDSSHHQSSSSIQKHSLKCQKVHIDENSYQSRKELEKEENDRQLLSKMIYDTDKFYKFHLTENIAENEEEIGPAKKIDDESFAGYKDFLGSEGTKTIRSAKGTVRGVKNRVRAGIATFLQINSTEKNYKEKDGGKVVVYTTTMGIVRDTYNACAKVKQILRTLLIKYEERDVFMSSDYQAEIKERMRLEHISVPQVFVDGQHIGDAEAVERLNESGELRRILKPYKSMDVCTTCKVCGGYRLLPCPVCNGSKKSVHRNHFTTEFVALKCMNCDEVGLVKCSSC